MLKHFGRRYGGSFLSRSDGCGENFKGGKPEESDRSRNLGNIVTRFWARSTDMNYQVLSPTEKLELKEAAAYIKSLPPTEPWAAISLLLPPHTVVNTNNIWKWLGLTLHAFFGDEDNPLPQSGLNEEIQKLIHEKNTEYTLLSLLIFQAEPFLQQEANALNAGIFWKKRSDILKQLAYEDCRYSILQDLISTTEDWTSHSERSRSDRFIAIERFLDGTLREKDIENMKKWSGEDAKLPRHSLKPEKECLFTFFCYSVFYKYRKELPAYESWAKYKPSDGQGQFAFINGELKRYPGRGGKKES